MLTYTKLKQNKRKFVVLTGITPRAFQSLLQAFQSAYDGYCPPTLTQAGTRRQRRIGGGRRGSLDNPEQKLLFALIYQKIHPAQNLLGAAFGLSQTRANRWVHHLLPMLEQAYKDLDLCLEGNSRRFASHELQAQGSSGLFISDLQRQREGLKDLEKYALYYRRRNKNHYDKHIVPGNGKLISCLDQTQVGKTPDIKLPEVSLVPIVGLG
jgi:hypothetical protein